MAAVAQIERAWHLFTVLLRLGRPASPAELAFRCVLPPAPSPDLVEFLCGIRGSPLLLAGNGLVMASEVAIAALGDFVPRAIAELVPRVGLSATVQRRQWGDVPLTYVRKRKASDMVEDPVLGVPRAKRRLFLPSGREFSENEEVRHQSGIRNGIQTISQEVQVSIGNILTKDILLFGISNTGFASSVLNRDCSFPHSICNSNAILSSFGSICSFHMGCGGENGKYFDNPLSTVVHEDIPDFQRYKDDFLSLDVNYNCCVPKAIALGGNKVSQPEIGPPLIDIVTDSTALCKETLREDSNSKTYSQFPAVNEMNLTKTSILGTEKELKRLSTKAGTIAGYAAGPTEKPEATEATDCKVEGSSINIGAFGGDHERCLSTGTERAASKLEPSVFHLSEEPCAVIKRPRKLFTKPKTADGIRSHTSKVAFNIRREGKALKHDQAKRDDKHLIATQKIKRSHIQNMHANENKGDVISKDPKNNLEPKLLPNFESFVIEEEEGSGGYGTVYRARRKTDGKVVAVKCPHANAHSHHIKNELKMLERFGGKHFVIKYEGSFMSGDSECFVLEHVEHDRPEVLKKEINIFELRWYGYCMFKALSSLHRQGIAHRDVKPGNFLFSRKLNKGYLIDFNLASDLHQKFLRKSKSQIESSISSNPVSMPSLKSTYKPQPRRYVKNGLLDNVTVEASNDLKKHVISNDMKKGSCRRTLDTLPKIINNSKCGSQAADVSGVTSTKDPTSTRTSADRLKQPIPCKGRKELINFLHETMQSPNHKALTVPVSQRKRVAAPLGQVDRRLVILTPMPLHSGVNAVAGAGMFKNEGNVKHKREGPCVGTKGFRAPEVLFKSFHQGCKVDIWSAGVTLLYLLIGRTPFGGDPEQNIKDISKLRGSEDLWEVAKLHNCESSYPSELFNVRFLESVKLKEWCEMNTKRPEFLEIIPQSLFDLVDKCLTVNPRCRITADEALNHEFFAPCHESLAKQKTLRKAAASESGGLSNKIFESSC